VKNHTVQAKPITEKEIFEFYVINAKCSKRLIALTSKEKTSNTENKNENKGKKRFIIKDDGSSDSTKKDEWKRKKKK
jgi:hypothetical protein